MSIRATSRPAPPTRDSRTHTCARCGITRPYRGGTRGEHCRDCLDVLALLARLERDTEGGAT